MTYLTAPTQMSWENCKGNGVMTYFTALTQMSWEKPQTARKWVKDGGSQGADLNFDDYLG